MDWIPNLIKTLREMILWPYKLDTASFAVVSIFSGSMVFIDQVPFFPKGIDFIQYLKMFFIILFLLCVISFIVKIISLVLFYCEKGLKQIWLWNQKEKKLKDLLSQKLRSEEIAVLAVFYSTHFPVDVFCLHPLIKYLYKKGWIESENEHSEFYVFGMFEVEPFKLTILAQTVLNSSDSEQAKQLQLTLEDKETLLNMLRERLRVFPDRYSL